MINVASWNYILTVEIFETVLKLILYSNLYRNLDNFKTSSLDRL